MRRRKDFTEAKKATIIKEIAKGKTTKSIAERINRHVVTVTRFLQNLSKRKPLSDRGVRKSVSKPGCMYRLRRNLRKMPGAASKRIFKEAGLPDVPKTTRNRILGKLGSMKTMIKRPSLTPKHKRLRMEWSRKYMKTDMKFVLFTDGSRASLDGPDGWAKGCVFNGDNCPNRMRRQQGGGGVMIWGGIIGNVIIAWSLPRS